MTKSTSDYLPVCVPELTADDEAAVAASIKDGWISSAGPAIEQFETHWSAYCGARFGVAVSNGTAALQVALDCLQLQPGDEVILPGLTIISCALAIVRAGAVPVPVECNASNYLIDPAAIAAAITSRTRAIMVVHLFGHPVDMAPIWQLAARHGLSVIEDAAQAHGAQYLDTSQSSPQWRRAGSLGTIATFSFYANKLITTGEGGMLLTDDAAIAARARSLRNLAFGKQRFCHERLGYNFRMTNPQAALGLSQSRRIDQILQRKQLLWQRYDELFADSAGVERMVCESWARSACWMYPLVIRAELGLDAANFAQRLAAYGVETRPFFVGLHQQPALRQLGLFDGLSLPTTELLSQYGLYLPGGLGLTDEQQLRVASAVNQVLREARHHRGK